MIRSQTWSRLTAAFLAAVFLALAGSISAQDAPKPIRALLVS